MSLIQTPHAVVPEIPLEHLASLSLEAAYALYTERENVIRLEGEDPYRYGHKPAMWRMVDEEIQHIRKRAPLSSPEMLLMGGNRGTKTEYAAWKLVNTMLTIPRARVWAIHNNEGSSIDIQQARIYKYLPAEWRPESGKMKRGKTTKITYNEATGFGDVLIFPNGSRCKFKFYSQDVANVEGDELDFAWGDEEMPLSWVEAVGRRCASRRGLQLLTFTPVSGYIPTVAYWLDEAYTIKSSPAEALPLIDPVTKAPALRPDGTPIYQEVPRLQRCRSPHKSVAYFHTKDNPYGHAYQDFLGKSVSQRWTRNKILCILYGVPTKIKGALFPVFKGSPAPTPGDEMESAPADDVHTCDVSLIPREGTLYLVCDPCNGRNFFMTWFLVTPDDRQWIIREWPQEGDYIPTVGDPGAWAVRSVKGKADGDKGPAQEPFGFGHQAMLDEIYRVGQELAREGFGRERGRPDYVVTIPEGKSVLDLAEEATLEEAFMDSRFGHSPTIRAGEVTTLIDEYADLGFPWEPASGDVLSEGITLIANALAYRVEEPISALNRPTLIIASRCRAIIYALQNHTGKDGEKGATKDPIDTLRYGLAAKLTDVSATRGRKKQKRGRGY